MQLQTRAPARHAPSPTARLLEASFQGVRYAAFPDSIGGVILARIADGWSTYIARGKEAQAFYSGAYAAIDAKDDAEDDGEAFDRAASEYDSFMESPAEMHGEPDTCGDFWHWAAPDRRAAA